MEVLETKASSGYAKPPWLFKGSALYQLHLVKAATARSFIPEEFRLVEAFGYTLGGFFLAHYDDSPVGVFDELVVIAGTVWNPPTSCAWAARVLVNNREACHHGRKDVGLPSHVAGFSKKSAAITENASDKSNSFLSMIGIGSSLHNTKNQIDVKVTDVVSSSETQFCSIKLPTSLSSESSSTNRWMGPVVKMSLPSFSGKTEYNPQLLKYSCQIECRVRPVKTAQVSGPINSGDEDNLSGSQNLELVGTRERSISLLLSKPLLALQFNFLRMQVEAPTIVVKSS
ncbi:hypothetical protein ACHQM5_010380 [Ranunculus cassubicifolius]